MLLREMSEDECLHALSGGRIARLGCALDHQPYVVPIYYAYHRDSDGESYLYGFTTVGQKVQWMRANSLVCVEWDEVTNYDHWESVIVFGRYEELSSGEAGEDTGQPPRLPMRAADLHSEDEQASGLRRAYELLREYPTWWQPGIAAYAASEHRDHIEPFKPLYYRIHIDRITGHRARPKVEVNEASMTSRPDRAHESWMRKVLRRVSGKSAP
jgi:nitroimidazol reductase NimA-like FMN-containing flavoprotein (pyridoxamine 5'-phosphate oxidase superfamily)